MTKSFFNHMHMQIQADDFIEYVDELIEKREFDKAKWTLEDHPYVKSLINVYGYSKLDELKSKLARAVDMDTL